MKIKSVGTFSLAECQEYLKETPNGEYAQKVANRMRYLQQEMKQDSDHKMVEFNTEFNRFYATRRYEEAFALCFQNLHNVKDKEKIVEKATLAISKLRKHIQIPSSIPISYEWLIDQLVLKGYKKMKYDGKSLKLKTIIVKISNKGNTTEIAFKCNIIKLFFSIVIISCLTAGLWVPVYFFVNIDEPDIFVPVAAAFFFFMMMLPVIIYPEKRERRTIKKILIEYLSK